ncbi:hypothetical protein GJAV_G00240040 [Gymnothorax javanicus]|nr:hypothetical protein GJAV_G00240040 [Gymnothorax javanicus]
MPFPPINLHQRITSPGKELFRKKKANIVPPQSLLGNKMKEENDSEKDKLSTSWPSTNLTQLGRKLQPQNGKFPAHVAADSLGTDGKNSWLTPPKPLANSCDSVPRSSSGESSAQKGNKPSSLSPLAKEDGGEEIQFSLSLTPEAILVIQKRNLEKQMMAKQQKCCGSADFRHRRVFPSKRAQAASKTNIPAAKLENLEDITAIVKISLLNDQYKYDDVEYEEEDAPPPHTRFLKASLKLDHKTCLGLHGKLAELVQFSDLHCFVHHHTEWTRRDKMYDQKMKYKGLDIHQTPCLPSISDKHTSSGCIKQNTNIKEIKKQSWLREDEDGPKEGFLASHRSDSGREHSIQQKAALDQRHLEVYWNSCLLQSVMRRRYAALLRQKVSKQRQQMKLCEPPNPKPPEHSKEQWHNASTVRRLPYCTLSHDDTYLKSIPKTDFYLILELQNELAQHGCLKTRQDQDQFWSMVGQNHKSKAQLRNRLKEIHMKMIGGRPAPDPKSVRFNQKEEMGPAPAIQITKHGESLQEQAVLCERKAGYCPQGKHPEERPEIGQMFPKVPMPKFMSLQPDYLERFTPKTFSQLKICEPPQKTRTTELSMQKLRLMYSRSLDNMAATQRLLNRNGISLCREENNSVRSLMEYVFPSDDSRVKQWNTGKQLLPRLSPLKTTSEETPAPSPQQNTAPPARITTPEVIPAESVLAAPKPPDPLTLEEASQQLAVGVMGRLGKTWTNSNMVESPLTLATCTAMSISATAPEVVVEKM